MDLEFSENDQAMFMCLLELEMFSYYRTRTFPVSCFIKSAILDAALTRGSMKLAKLTMSLTLSWLK